ncbi:MAG: hypothetical protein R6W68_09160 [Ignavibacteriaceae bacterium]
MEEQQLIIGEFEDEYYARIAIRELEAAGIRTNILKDSKDLFVLFSEEQTGVQLVIPGTQLEKAKEILSAKFF